MKEAKSLVEIVKSGGASYEALIKKAIEDEQTYGDLSASMVALFTTGSDEERLLAISVAEHLGDRRFAEHLTKLLADSLASTSHLPAWGGAAIDLVSELTPPSDPKRSAIFRACIARSDTRLAGWRLSQKMDAEACGLCRRGLRRPSWGACRFCRSTATGHLIAVIRTITRRARHCSANISERA